MNRLRVILFRFTSTYSAFVSRLFHGTTAPRMLYRPLVRNHFRRRMAKVLTILIVSALGIISSVQFIKHQDQTIKITKQAFSVKSKTQFPNSKESSDSTDEESEQPEHFALVRPTLPAQVWDAKAKKWRIQEDSPTLNFPLLRPPFAPSPKAT